MLIDGCIHLDNGKTDSWGQGCSYYDGKPSMCGYFDDADFNAKQLCCSCGGVEGMNMFVEFN